MRRVAEFKRDNASLLDGLLPEHEKVAFLEHKVVNVLKGRDDKGRRVLIVSVGGFLAVNQDKPIFAYRCIKGL
ncbi:jg16792, partial [Pararge aegeria aegeria]